MSVYVDAARIPYGRMKMSHMVADSTAELLAMVDAIGVQRKWIQHPGTPKEHFDVCEEKRLQAIARGAIQMQWRDYALFVRRRQLNRHALE